MDDENAACMLEVSTLTRDQKSRGSRKGHFFFAAVLAEVKEPELKDVYVPWLDVDREGLFPPWSTDRVVASYARSIGTMPFEKPFVPAMYELRNG